MIGAQFQLPLERELFRLAVVTVSGMSLSALHYYGRLPQRWLLVHLTINPFLLQAFLWSWVIESRPPAALALAALPLLIAAYQSYLTHLSLRHPYAAIGTLLASAWALLAAKSNLVRMEVGVSSAIGIAVDFWLGANAKRDGHLRRERDELRQAVEAQLLAQKSAEVRLQAEALQALRGFAHDASNAVSAAMANAETLTARLRALDPAPESEAIGARLAASLGQLSAMSQDARTAGLRVPPALERVQVNAVLNQAAAEILAPPKISFALQCLPAPLSAAVRGGRTSLHRIVSNLLRNACEGDGRLGASAVEAQLVTRDGFVELTIRDNGPGFTAAQITAAAPALSSTKAHGLGLGLYIVEQLARASGGELQRSNHSQGGAQLLVRLPLWPEFQ